MLDATAAGVAGPHPDARTSWSREAVTTGAIVACAPLALLLFNRDWFLTREGVLDAWQYVGLFEHYTDPAFASGAYKLARLPWILTGFAAHRLWSPLTAAYVLHGALLCAAPVALFAALVVLLRRVALAGVLAIAFGFYTHAHGSGGWDYHNTASGVLYLLAVTLLALPSAIEGRRSMLIATGAVLALAVHTNILLVNSLPVLAFVYVRVVQVRAGIRPPGGTLVRRAAWVTLGAVLITLLLGSINWVVGREFLFFRVLLNLATDFVVDPGLQSGWWHAWLTWLPIARYLALPSVVFLAGLATLVTRRPVAPDDRLASVLVGQFLVLVAIWIGWQSLGQTALDPIYMAYPLTPSCFLALGGLLAPLWPDACERRGSLLVVTAAVGFAVALEGVLDPALRPLVAAVAPVVGVLGCCVFGAGLLAWFLRPGVVASFVLILVFALGNRLMVNRADLYAATDACKIEPAVYTAIVESASWLAEFDPTFSRVRTWFDEGERIQPAPACTVRVGAVGSAITAMAYVPYVTNPFPMPGVDDVPEAALQALARDGAILTIITNAPDHLQRWGRRLDGLRLAHEEVARHDTRILGSEFAIHAWQIAAAAPHVSGFEPPIISITPRTPPEINVYGTPKGRIVTDGDRVRFVPTDARDHVAYPFVPLSLAADSWARVVVEAQPSVSRSCHVIVQATDLVVLATLGCGAGTAVVPVPRKTQGIRLYLTDATRTAFELPAKIDVSLAQPPF